MHIGQTTDGRFYDPHFDLDHDGKLNMAEYMIMEDVIFGSDEEEEEDDEIDLIFRFSMFMIELKIETYFNKYARWNNVYLDRKTDYHRVYDGYGRGRKGFSPCDSRRRRIIGSIWHLFRR